MHNLKPKEGWDYYFFWGGIFAGIAFVILFVRTPRWVGYGRVAEIPFAIILAVFGYVGARSGVWLYERTIGRPERERTAAIRARVKAAAEREQRTREAAEYAERVDLYQKAAEVEDLRMRCKQYETEVRVLRAELARHTPALAANAQTLYCE